MTARSWFNRLGTAAKLLLALSFVLLPIGGLLVWSALRDFDETRAAISSAAQKRAELSATSLEGLIARNALALRVAANAALKADVAQACKNVATTLATGSGAVRPFEIEQVSGKPTCSVGDFSDIVNPPRIVAGELLLWIAEDGRSLLLRTGVAGGSATTRLTRLELIGALHSRGARFSSASLSDGRRQIILIGTPDPTGAGAYSRSIAPVGGPLDVRIASPARSITVAERALILLPVLMWAIATFLSWWLVDRLLISPLRRLQRSVTAYRPGDDTRILADQDFANATEIQDLRDAFVRAVERIEETERGMAEALEGQRKLVREVHHRVKNNLQVVASLLSIHGRTADSAEGKAAFSAIGRRVDALSVVHRNHFAALEENQGIALRALLTELAQGLRASATESQRPVMIELDVEQASTTQDVAVAIAFLITEIVEYAMLECSTEPVEITLRRASPLTGTLTVASSVLLAADSDGDEPVPAGRRQFERIIEGLARQLRSPLERRLGRYGVDLPLFPERG